MNTNTNTEEWGNIELPGLSDEKLFSTNWNHVAAANERAQDENWLNHQRRRWKENPQHFAKMNEAKKKKLELNPDIYKESYKKIGEKNKNNPIWRERVGRYERTEETVTKQIKKLKKRIQTPFGIFDSRKQASEFLSIDPATLGLRMNKFPNEYYYIDEQGNRLDIIRKDRKASIKKSECPCITPLGEFINIRSAAKAHGWTHDKIKSQMVANPHLFYKKNKGPGKAPKKTEINTPFGIFKSIPQAFNAAKELGNAEGNSPYYWFDLNQKKYPDKFFKQ